mmetsp:Transcript_11967/g.24291  ORF Transcript_11967/g.24291 Transcript_11967/m.24291 type:complete len:279 (+) Transcript_11967:493-1329(+)
MQGRIGAANVLSDLYAEGVEHCDFMLMLLAASLDMERQQQSICTREMIRGFRDACDEAEVPITGGQTVLNPWPIIGGVATAIVAEGEFVKSDGAKVGDVLVLTKALGTQVAANVHQWRKEDHRFWNKCVEKDILTVEDAEDMMHQAVISMARLNRNGGRLMTKYDAHACTDVTGFGILGHAQNLCDNQVEAVGMELHTLPFIKKTPIVNNEIFNFRLMVGYSAETSGGLMISMPADKAQGYIDELKELDGCDGWIIGNVVADANRKARIMDDVKILEV